jgi:hypothetical protein
MSFTEKQQKIIDRWLSVRENAFGKKEFSNHECNSVCLEKDIDTIDFKERLYGCLESGKVHLCNVDSSCKDQILNQDGVWICVFSRIIIQSHFDDKLVGPVDKDEARSNECVTKYLLDSDGEESPSEIPYGNIVKNIKCKKIKKSVQLSGHRDRADIAGNIIFSVLWNTKERKRLIEKNESHYNNQISIWLKRYCKALKKRNIRPSLPDILNHFRKYENSMGVIRIEEYEPNKRELYVEKCMKLWSIITQSPYYEKNKSRYNFPSHVLATLDLMGEGHSIQYPDDTKVVIFEPDPYIKKLNLKMTDLNSLNIANCGAKKDVTCGINNIRQSLLDFKKEDLENLISSYRLNPK